MFILEKLENIEKLKEKLVLLIICASTPKQIGFPPNSELNIIFSKPQQGENDPISSTS